MTAQLNIILKLINNNIVFRPKRQWQIKYQNILYCLFRNYSAPWLYSYKSHYSWTVVHAYTVPGWVCSNHRFPLKSRGRKWSELFLFSGSFTEFCFAPSHPTATPLSSPHPLSTWTKRRNDTICSINYSAFFPLLPITVFDWRWWGDGAFVCGVPTPRKGTAPFDPCRPARAIQSPLRL